MRRHNEINVIIVGRTNFIFFERQTQEMQRSGERQHWQNLVTIKLQVYISVVKKVISFESTYF